MALDNSFHGNYNSLMASHLKDHIGFWMRLVSNHVSSNFALKLSAYDISVSEWVILREIFESPHPLPVLHLANAIGFTKGAVSKITAKLEEKELLRREADNDDGRAQKLAITLKGKKLIPLLAKEADRNDEETFAVLSVTKQRTLKALLREIAEQNNLDVYPVN